mgnify:FL=1
MSNSCLIFFSAALKTRILLRTPLSEHSLEPAVKLPRWLVDQLNVTAWSRTSHILSLDTAVASLIPKSVYMTPEWKSIRWTLSLRVCTLSGQEFIVLAILFSSDIACIAISRSSMTLWSAAISLRASFSRLVTLLFLGLVWDTSRVRQPRLARARHTRLKICYEVELQLRTRNTLAVLLSELGFEVFEAYGQAEPHRPTKP